VTTTEAAAADDVTAPFVPYTSDSFFRSHVEGAPIDAARTDTFHTFMATFADQQAVTWPKVNMNDNWAMSYAVSTAADPVWKLTGTVPPAVAMLNNQGFHMPDSMADTFPTGPQDRPGLVVDTALGYSVLFADAVPNKTTRTISVSSAGMFWHSSNGLDKRNPKTNDTRNWVSRGRIPDAMTIRRDLLDYAVANNTGLGHVLHLYLAETRTADGYCHPLVRAENNQFGFGAEGERLRIAPGIDLAARGLTGAALAVARTLQQNGCYIGDNSGCSSAIKASQSFHYTGTNLTTDCLKGMLSWQDFQVVQRGWQ
jgi:hypothetical protein